MVSYHYLTRRTVSWKVESGHPEKLRLFVPCTFCCLLATASNNDTSSKAVFVQRARHVITGEYPVAEVVERAALTNFSVRIVGMSFAMTCCVCGDSNKVART
jgi:hypothetical protein